LAVINNDGGNMQDEIKRENWTEYFKGFSKRNQARPKLRSLSITFFLLLFFLALSGPGSNAALLNVAQDKNLVSQSQESNKKEKLSAVQESEGIKSEPHLWAEPVDLETRDLFYGIGGKKGAPDPSGHFKFIEIKPGGSSKKIIVEDDKGRKWTVKFGPEARPETAVTRIVWAAGYHVDQDYFVKEVRIAGWNEPVVRDIRFERDNDGFKTVGRWDWKLNPFAGTREMEGLKALMALVKNFDVKTENNKIVQPGKKAGDSKRQIYYVNDLGATFGSTGKWFNWFPICGELPAGTKGIAKDYAGEKFIQRVEGGKVYFRIKRWRARRAVGTVKIENAVWMGNLLGRLSDKQLTDAFLAGGFSDAEVSIYVKTLKDRIMQLRSLEESGAPVGFRQE
jgi:hypothetical protein